MIILTMRGFVVSTLRLCFEGFWEWVERGEGITLIFQRYVIWYIILDTKRQQTGEDCTLLRQKTALGHDYLLQTTLSKEVLI